MGDGLNFSKEVKSKSICLVWVFVLIAFQVVVQIVGGSHEAWAYDWTRYFTFSNQNEAQIRYSFNKNEASLSIHFAEAQLLTSTREIYVRQGKFHLLGQADSRNPTQGSALNQFLKVQGAVTEKLPYFWIQNLADNTATYIFEDSTAATSCSKGWTAARARFVDFHGQRFLLESVKEGGKEKDGETFYLSKNLTGTKCISLNHAFLPTLHESSKVEVSEEGILKIQGVETLFDLKSQCLLHPVKDRPDFVVKSCQQASLESGVYLVRFSDLKHFPLDRKKWTRDLLPSDTSVSDGIFTFNSLTAERRIDLDQFDAELKRLARRSSAGVVMGENGKPIDALLKIRSNYTDLVSDSIAHPELYPESSSPAVNEHVAEAFWSRRSVMLLGKPGTGKSSAVRAFARDVGRGSVRGLPRTTEIFDVDVSSLLSGTKFVGMTEQRIAELISAAKQSGCIFFIDEFHTLAGSGTNSHKSNDITQFFKKGLASGEFLLMGTDTSDEFYNAFGHDPAFIERFEVKKLNPPEGTALHEIIKGRFKSEFNRELSQDLIELATDLSQNYDVTAAQPRSALNLLKKAVARLAFAGREGEEITPQNLKETAVLKYGFDPAELSPARLRSKVSQLKSGLDQALIGQVEAKDLVYRVWVRKVMGVGSDEKINSLLLAGPPGVGKTRIAELSADLMGYKKTVIEMNKFAERGIELFRREIYQALLEHPFRVIVLDEIEKAHSTVQTAALSMLQTGAFRVTEEMPSGKTVVREVSAKHALFVLTSNAAGYYIKNELKRSGSLDETELRRHLLEDGISEAILSRIQHVVPMTTPTQKEYRVGVEKSLALTLKRESDRHGFKFILENEDEFIADVMKSHHEDTDYREIGKQMLRIEDLIADALMSDEREAGAEVKLHWVVVPLRRHRWQNQMYG